jgi:hypothetical protein
MASWGGESHGRSLRKRRVYWGNSGALFLTVFRRSDPSVLFCTGLSAVWLVPPLLISLDARGQHDKMQSGGAMMTLCGDGWNQHGRRCETLAGAAVGR